MKTLFALACALGLAGCTPGADHGTIPAPIPSMTASPATTVTIDVNLTLNAPASTPYGLAGGYRAAVTTVPLGAAIRFMNSDGFAHTATSIGQAGAFPVASPFGAEAIQQSGGLLSQGWTSGTLQAGTSSQTLIADQRGTFLYGCFFHYGSPMRAAIVVQ